MVERRGRKVTEYGIVAGTGKKLDPVLQILYEDDVVFVKEVVPMSKDLVTEYKKGLDAGRLHWSM